MSATARDDGLVRSHEEAVQLLRYAVPGARVTTAPIFAPGRQSAAEAMRRYEITVERVGREPITTCAVYCLPALAVTLAHGARQAADRALAAA